MASLRSRIEALEACATGRVKMGDRRAHWEKIQRPAINRIWDLLEQGLPGEDSLQKICQGTHFQLAPNGGKSHITKKSELAARIKSQTTTAEDDALLSTINADCAVFDMTGAEFVVWDAQLLDSF